MRLDELKSDLMVHAKQVERPDAAIGGRGIHIGEVDCLEFANGGRYIKLKVGGSIDGKAHWIPLEWVEGVDDKAVYLNRDAEDVIRDMLDVKPLH